MQNYYKEFFLLLFVIILGASCFYFGMSIREVNTYTCVYTYERQGAFETTRYYRRGIDCSSNLTEFDMCRGGSSHEVGEQTSRFYATDRDVAGAHYNGVFIDGVSINTTALNSTISMN